MKHDPLISIIIVNYNGKKYLEECLNSIYNGSYKNFEIIIIYDDENQEDLEYLKKIRAIMTLYKFLYF